jgi:hypothetical protein
LRYLSHPLREAFLQKSSRSPREAEPRPDLKDAGVVLPHNGSTYRPGFLGTVSSVSMNASKRAAPAAGSSELCLRGMARKERENSALTRQRCMFTKIAKVKSLCTVNCFNETPRIRSLSFSSFASRRAQAKCVLALLVGAFLAWDCWSAVGLASRASQFAGNFWGSFFEGILAVPFFLIVGLIVKISALFR